MKSQYLRIVSKPDIQKIERIKKLFDQLKSNGVEWEGMDGGGGGSLFFFKMKEGFSMQDLPYERTEYGETDNAAKFQNQINDNDRVIGSEISINVTVP